jgi:hypothetical protein
MYTARWGLSLNFGAVASKIPSCPSCFRGLLIGLSNNNNVCTECTNWVTDDPNNVLLWYKPPPSYPGLEEEGMLRPMRITYDKLIKAVSMTQKNIMDGTWDKSSARSYLCVHGLNKEAIEHLITGDWEHPALWTRGTELCQHIDVPMHLIS